MKQLNFSKDNLLVMLHKKALVSNEKLCIIPKYIKSAQMHFSGIS